MIPVKMIVQHRNQQVTDKQKLKFIETIKAGFWQLEEEQEDTDTTTTCWTREFKKGKKPKQILKSTQNLVYRAAEYGDILSLEASINIGDAPPFNFSHQAERPSEYFLNKTWR